MMKGLAGFLVQVVPTGLLLVKGLVWREMMKGSDYAGSCSAVDSFEALTKRLAEDMQRSIRSLEFCAVLSPDWNETTDKLCRIANVSDTERTFSAAPAPAGAPPAAAATLWEGHEVALRYLVEDGKVILCLRLLEGYLTFLQDADAAGRAFDVSAVVCKSGRIDPSFYRRVPARLLWFRVGRPDESTDLLKQAGSAMRRPPQ